MEKLNRKTQKIFAGSTEIEGNIAIFGSLREDLSITNPESPDDPEIPSKSLYSGDPDDIQSQAYENGWGAAVVSDDSPALEDMNALFYLITRQLAYVFEMGIPEWDSNTTYYKGSICSWHDPKAEVEKEKLFVSRKEDNKNNPPTDEAHWIELGSDKATIEQLNDAIEEINNRIDMAELSSNSVDVVGTLEDLMAYDTKDIKPNDIITVIQGENENTAYYRWMKGPDAEWRWTFIIDEPPLPKATKSIAGIVKLGVSGGAARYDFVKKLADALGLKAEQADLVTLQSEVALKAEAAAVDTALAGKENSGVAAELVNAHASDTDNPHAVTKAQVGLGNVENTSDANKPVSMAVTNALDQKADKNDGRFHEHANKAALDRIGENAGSPTWNGGTWPGGAGGESTDGITPHIGANGNWWIGTTDTGVKAAATNGADGKNAWTTTTGDHNRPALGASLSANVADNSAFSNGQLITIGNEYYQVTAKSGANIIVATRLNLSENTAIGTIPSGTAIMSAGARGAKGDTGTTPSITVSAATLPAGSQATVTKTGSDTSPHFTFGIPKGADGINGDGGGSAPGAWPVLNPPVEDGPGCFLLTGASSNVGISLVPNGVYEFLNAGTGIKYIYAEQPQKTSIIGPNGNMANRIVLFNAGAVRLYNHNGIFFTLSSNALVQFQTNGSSSS